MANLSLPAAVSICPNSFPQRVFIAHLLGARYRENASDQNKAAVLGEQAFQEGRKTRNEHTTEGREQSEESNGAATSQSGQRRPEAKIGP